MEQLISNPYVQVALVCIVAYAAWTLLKSITTVIIAVVVLGGALFFFTGTEIPGIENFPAATEVIQVIETTLDNFFNRDSAE